MQHLILMRHAKSDWSHEGLSDKDRPLNGRGRLAAPRMAQWLAGQIEASPELELSKVLSSSSTRTRQTWGAMEDHLADFLSGPNASVATEFKDSLYLATPNQIWEEIRAAFATLGETGAGGDHESSITLPSSDEPQSGRGVLVLGHNPGMEILIRALSNLECEVPTATIAIFRRERKGELPDLISSVEAQEWSLVELQIPKNLAD